MLKKWSKAEIERLYSGPILELIHQAALTHRQYHKSDEIQINHLISIKTGGCEEDCKYCAQSAQYKTFVKPTPLMPLQEIIEKSLKAKSLGATRVCLGVAQREMRNGLQFERILQIVKAVTSLGLEVCCTMGMLDVEQAKRLAEAGTFAYSHNLDTSRNYYPSVITTRCYDDRLKTIELVKQSGMQVCSGGILGLGESREDRIELIEELANLNPYPGSVSINLLAKVKGTPYENNADLPRWEIVRTIATARICMPKAMVRLSAGRESLSREMQAFCFMAGANSFFIGEKLLTVPNPTYDEDVQMLEELSLKMKVVE